MFKIIGGKINVLGRWVGTVAGTHTIRIQDDGTITTDTPGGKDVVAYTLRNDGHITIDNLIPPPQGIPSALKRPVDGLDWRGLVVLSRGPLYSDNASHGAGGRVKTVLAEGFLFTFNYYAMANVVMAKKQYSWTGGRVCFSSFLSPGGAAMSSMFGGFTAIPAAMSCGTAGANSMLNEGAIMPPSMGGFSFMNAMQKDAIEYYGNSTSIVFSYRSHRKYMFFTSNVDGLFETGLGSIAGSADNVRPNGPLPDPGDVSFRFSMFSLRQ